jgi:hypothetical protein
MAQARRQRLALEGARPLGRRHLLQGCPGGHAGAVLVIEELDVAAERDPCEAPAGAIPVIESEDFAPEADGKGLDLHAAPAGDQKMAELVDEHHDRQHEQER